MRKISKSVFAFALIIVLSACSSPMVRMSAEPPSDIDRTKGRPISASACGFQLAQLIPIGTNGRQQKAYDSLKTQAGRDFIGDVVETEKWYYGVIGSVYCTQLDAKSYPKRVP
jgi:hypothetical protein